MIKKETILGLRSLDVLVIKKLMSSFFDFLIDNHK
jgi:hypothetical protein